MSNPHATVDVRSGDGSLYAVRPIDADDKPLISAGFERLSPRSRYLRFFSPTPVLSSAQLDYLSHPDHRDHIALGVLDGAEPVAVGRFFRLPDEPDSADTAITVVDAYQGRGVAHLVVQVLALAARHRNIRWLHFDVLAENRPMMAVLDDFDATRTETGPVIHALVDVEKVPPPALYGDLVALLDRAAGDPAPV